MSTLAQDIKDFQKEFLAQAPQESVDTIFSTTEALVKSGIAEKSLSVGAKFPSFILNNATGKSVSSEELFKQGPTIINYYRGSWCPYCNLELAAYQKHLDEIKAKGAQLVAINPQQPDNTLNDIEKHGLQFDVLTDEGQKLAKEIGIYFNLAVELKPVYEGFGIDLKHEEWALPIPATYIVDTNGVILYAFVNADYSKRAEPSEVIAQLP